MKEIVIPQKIDPAKLDRHQYTLSLLNEGIKTGLLSAERAEHLQTELMILLSKAIPKYTRHESSSVPTDIAQSILQSLLYNMDLFLCSLSSPELAIAMLHSSTLSECFHRGTEITAALVQDAKQLWRLALDTMLDVSLTAYTETISSGFTDFFYRYDGKYAAHSTGVVVDYPLLFDDMDWMGIIYVKNYLQSLVLENKLCNEYPGHEVQRLLSNCGKQFNLPSAELMVNLADIILKNSLASIILGRSAQNLSLTARDCQELAESLLELSWQDCCSCIRQALKTLLCQLNLEDSDLCQYLLSYPDLIFPPLQSALDNNALSGFFVIEPEQEAAEPVLYLPGDRLSDEELRLIIEALEYFRYGASKADFVLAKVRNIDDLLEILGAFRFYRQEFFALYSQLNDNDLALLSKHCCSEYTDNEPDFSWKVHLFKYLESVPARKKMIQDLAKIIE